MQLTFAYLSFVLVLASAHAQLYTSGSCPEVKSLTKLDVKKLTKTVWYEYSGYPHKNLDESSCITFQYEDPKKTGLSIKKTVAKKGKKESIINKVTYLGSGKFKLEKSTNINKFIAPDYTILDTDYKNYVIMYNCKTVGKRSAMNLVIQTSKANPPETLLAETKAILSALKLPYPKVVTDKTKCPK